MVKLDSFISQTRLESLWANAQNRRGSSYWQDKTVYIPVIRLDRFYIPNNAVLLLDLKISVDGEISGHPTTPIIPKDCSESRMEHVYFYH